MKKKEGSRKNDKKDGKKSKSKDRTDEGSATTFDNDRTEEGGVTTFDNDPPIIVQGGSVTIESTVFLSVSYDATKKKYIYATKDIKIGRMRMRGKRGDQDDDSDNGKFKIELSE
ncbi:MAG: hypothetical protein LC800_21100 [Acidobacteria bacterium]|nr:hypothetical protein [Acidobacteriota bacterium]